MLGCERVKPSTILSVAPIMNSDPPTVYIELSCSVCDEPEILIVSLADATDHFRWPEREFYFVCERHRASNSN
jgi:hypothetical protein